MENKKFPNYSLDGWGNPPSLNDRSFPRFPQTPSPPPSSYPRPLRGALGEGVCAATNETHKIHLGVDVKLAFDSQSHYSNTKKKRTKNYRKPRRTNQHSYIESRKTTRNNIHNKKAEETDRRKHSQTQSTKRKNACLRMQAATPTVVAMLTRYAAKIFDWLWETTSYSDWTKGYARVYLKMALVPCLTTLQFPSIWITDCAKFSIFRHFGKFGQCSDPGPC